MLPECMVWALESYASSFVEIFCGDENPEDVVKEFTNIFKENWKTAFHDTIKDVGVGYLAESNYYPKNDEECCPLAGFSVKDNVCIVQFDPLLIPYCYGDFCEITKACDCLDYSVMELKSKHPGIEYAVMVEFPWSDRRCGDIDEYSILSHEKYKDSADQIVCEIVDKAVENKLLFDDTALAEDPEWCFLEKLRNELAGYDEDVYEDCLRFLKENKGRLKEKSFNKIMGVVKTCLEEDDDVKEYIEENVPFYANWTSQF